MLVAAGRRLRLREPRRARQAHRARSSHEQVEPALALKPDLVTFSAGGNDVIRPGTDPDAVAQLFEDAVVRLRSDGATVVVFTGIDTNFTPVFRGIRGKVAIYNENIRAIADRYDCIVADQWALKEVQDMRFFDDDRLHYNPLGHHEVARMVLRALNVPNDLQPMQPDPLPNRTWREARAVDLVWAREYFVPWVLRRVRHQSSGDDDHREAARPAADHDARAGERRRGRRATADATAPERSGACSRSAQSATALAAATLSESTPPAIGIVTTVSAAASARRLSPSPSAPSSSATRSGPVARRTRRAARRRRQRERGEVESRVVEDAARLRPLRQARPRHLEDRAHAHPHAPAVERVGAARAHEHGVGAEAGGARGRSRRRWCDRRCLRARRRAAHPRRRPRPAASAGRCIAARAPRCTA